MIYNIGGHHESWCFDSHTESLGLFLYKHHLHIGMKEKQISEKTSWLCKVAFGKINRVVTIIILSPWLKYGHLSESLVFIIVIAKKVKQSSTS